MAHDERSNFVEFKTLPFSAELRQDPQQYISFCFFWGGTMENLEKHTHLPVSAISLPFSAISLPFSAETFDVFAF